MGKKKRKGSTKKQKAIPETKISQEVKTTKPEKSIPSPKQRGISSVLCALFFLTGASALLFETLWFRLAGLTFGNSVWASALVLSSFMAGLALGNGLAARYGDRIEKPIRFYARLEMLVAITGIGLVLILPLLTTLFAPLFRMVLNNPWVLNPLRLSSAFLLMMIPSSAMGMTLPLLVKALYIESPHFGRVLGKLYGWNTLGAVFGALIGEALFIELLGIRMTAFVAGMLNALAAVGALHISKGFRRILPVHEQHINIPSTFSSAVSRGKKLLIAGFLSGSILLSLEVVWFRLMQLFVVNSTAAFALMLSVVLTGIGLGGVFVSLWFRWQPNAERFLSALALLAGAVSVAVYYSFNFVISGYMNDPFYGYRWSNVLYLSLWLMLPVSFFSGILFTMIGKAAHQVIGDETKTAGLLTMANTIGAMIGPLLTGFFLLPKLGIEKSLFILSVAYLGVAVFCLNRSHILASLRQIALYSLTSVLLLFCVVFFPFGLMDRYVATVNAQTPGGKDLKMVAFREGLINTIQCLRQDFLGKPIRYKLLTNGFSMSDTSWNAKRYMKLFVYWPMAVNPNIKKALLICYGIGNTAKALTDDKRLESIDVVDISKDIIEMSDVVFSGDKGMPLDDPRVSVHIEDGRFFLLATNRKFDLVTAEPPPLENAGVINLYTQEYFELVYDRLTEGGIVTYWLPVDTLGESEAKSILKGFCNVFEDCSLWRGERFNWMMVGSRNFRGPVKEEDFSVQWSDPAVLPEMQTLGIEHPEQLGALFLMDSAQLQELTQDSPPLRDNYPKLISTGVKDVLESQRKYLLDYMNTSTTKKQFEDSTFIKSLWDKSLYEKMLKFFEFQDIITLSMFSPPSKERFVFIHRILTDSGLRTPVLLLMNSDDYRQEIISQVLAEGQEMTADIHYHLGVRAMADRNYVLAEQHFSQAQDLGWNMRILYYRIYLLCMAGEQERAQELADSYALFLKTWDIEWYWDWMTSNFGSITRPGS